MRDDATHAAEAAVWGRYLSYDDIARFEYGRRLWRLPEMRLRLLAHWLDERHPHRERFLEQRELIESVLASEESVPALDARLRESGTSLRCVAREIPVVFGEWFAKKGLKVPRMGTNSSMNVICPNLWTASAVCLLVGVLLGCSSSGMERLNASFRLAEVVNGDSVFLVSINGKEFEHRSTSGSLELFQNKERNTLRVRVTSGRGTFISTGIDHYYHVDNEGKVTYLGSLKSSWYEDERSVSYEMSGFKAIRLKGKPGLAP